jgi:transposase
MLVIWDGLPAHRSRRVSDWVTSDRDWLKVEPLPGYAPDLNPVEQVWGNLKVQELANLCSDTIEQVADQADYRLPRRSR